MVRASSPSLKAWCLLAPRSAPARSAPTRSAMACAGRNARSRQQATPRRQKHGRTRCGRQRNDGEIRRSLAFSSWQWFAGESQDGSFRNPNGPYGPNRCLVAFVWRDTCVSDVVCVTPEIRKLVKEENTLYARRSTGGTSSMQLVRPGTDLLKPRPNLLIRPRGIEQDGGKKGTQPGVIPIGIEKMPGHRRDDARSTGGLSVPFVNGGSR